MAATKQRNGRKKRKNKEKKFKETEQMPRTIEAMAAPPSSFLSDGAELGWFNGFPQLGQKRASSSIWRPQ